MPESDTPMPAAPPKAKRSVNNTAQAKYIVDSEATLIAALNPENTDLTAPLTSAGYGPAALAIGQALATDALKKFGLRQGGIAEMREAQDLLDAARATAHDHYVAYKTIARASFTSQPDRTALALIGDVPDDLDLFIAAAHTSYTAGKLPPYTAKLTLRGYPPARMDTLLAELETLGNSDAHATSQGGDAVFTTEQRNEAYELLREWMAEFNGVVLGLFRKNPSARHKLKI